KTTYTGKEVVQTGKNPWQIVSTQVTLTVKNSALTSATQLDANFNAMKTVPISHTGAGIRLTLPPDTLYLVLRQ
ncbi:MAG TPA: hypothetical protein VKU00_24750, partial [Chthonomonadaceae bacterium]|nr:hypothetical protein [Chthonomonadaceae bacterium]